MLTSPETNITFTDKQKQQQDEAKRRLMNFESEISIATKNIKSLREETENALKERKYQEELLELSQTKVKALEQLLDVMNTTKEKVKSEIDAHTAHSTLLEGDNLKKKTELDSREKKVLDLEIAHVKKVENFIAQEIEIEKKQKTVEKIQLIFDTAIKSIESL